MLPRQNRLTSAQFERAFSASQTLRHPLLTLRVHVRGDGNQGVRAAFVVPKKVAKKATARNSIRRQVREAYRLHELRGLPEGCDLIFLATTETEKATRAEIEEVFTELLGRAKGKSRGGKSREKAQNGTGAHLPMHSIGPTQTEQESHPEPENKTQFLPLTFLALTLIRFYQRFISPSLPPSCRFEPTCSHYTLASIERFGLWRGGFLGARRICRCQPFCEGGFDPVPERFPTFKLRENPRKSPLQRRFFAFFRR